MEKMFILLLKMGVNRLGQPREATSELNLDHNVTFSRHPSGRVSPAEDRGLPGGVEKYLHSRWAGGAWLVRPKQKAGNRPSGTWVTKDPDAFLTVERFE